jgi:hypothetical protein
MSSSSKKSFFSSDYKDQLMITFGLIVLLLGLTWGFMRLYEITIHPTRHVDHESIWLEPTAKTEVGN